jgi:cyclopropane fatty-acyl-phospholipid synthase-like methyltransferase
MCKLSKQYGIVKDKDTILEIGSGWCHWEAITLRLFFDIKAVLFDVWDNRQFDVLKSYLAQLKANLGKIETDDSKLKKADDMIRAILSLRNFSELYSALGFQYVVEPSGRLSSFKGNRFDLIVSAGVLEHINRCDIPLLVADFHRLLNPNGHCVHSINLTDHLYLYDKAVSPKQCLKYSNRLWQWCFENKVQYFNRVQRPEWLGIFEKSRFVLIEEESDHIDIGVLSVDKQYSNLSKHDLGCISLNVTCRK